jgi:fructose-1,6-bisphosphatase/inositol monophosphatase family enzyme
MTADQDQLLAFAVSIARAAGDIMRDYSLRSDKGVETKPDGTPVTAADKAINQLLIDRVMETYPEHGVLGEEDSWQATRSQLWVCDPIDGTVAFMYGIPTAMFSLALVIDGTPIVAVTYNPATDQLYTATRGGGAFCNERRIHVSTNTITRWALVIGPSMSQSRARTSLFDRLQQSGLAYIRPLYGGVFRHCLIAEGKAEADMWGGSGAHDIAAVKLIVEEAGGKVTDMSGQQQRYDAPLQGAIVSNGNDGIHNLLITSLREYGIDTYLGAKR